MTSLITPLRGPFCVCPTHVLLGPFLPKPPPAQPPSQSWLWPVGAGRLNVMTPFSSVPSETLLPINFHSAFTKIPGLSPPSLISNTCTNDTKKHCQNSCANATIPLQNDSKLDDSPYLACLRSWRHVLVHSDNLVFVLEFRNLGCFTQRALRYSIWDNLSVTSPAV